MTDATAQERALATGRTAFGAGWNPAVIATAPGRLELLGNHIDYNGGPVLAAAIDRTTVILADEATSGVAVVRVVMADAAGRPEETLQPGALADWVNPNPPPSPFDYVRGAIAATLAANPGHDRWPARIAVAGDVPMGFGLSSSAALCVALILALQQRRGDDRDLVLAAQAAENRAGTPCGTMDQFASVAGGVILYDGTTVSAERLRPDLGDLAFAVADSGVRRELGASSYPVRVRESREALTRARAVLGDDVPNLAAVDRGGLDRVQASDARLPETLFKRAWHVASEVERVNEGVNAVRRGAWQSFGALMTASGRSSATDYEISHPRVEALVAASLSVDGVLGARMMGGGEGGTALVLLPRGLVPALIDRLDREVYRALGERGSDKARVFGFAPGAALNRRTED